MFQDRQKWKSFCLPPFSDWISISFQSKTWSFSFLNSAHVENFCHFLSVVPQQLFYFPEFNNKCVCVLPLPQTTTPDVKRGGLVQVAFCFSNFMLDPTGGKNYTLVILLQTLSPFMPRPRCFSLHYASPAALISLYKRQTAPLYKNVKKKSWKRASKISYLPSLLLFLYLLFFLYFAIGLLIKYLDKK